jgi:hypothetical protein
VHCHLSQWLCSWFAKRAATIKTICLSATLPPGDPAVRATRMEYLQNLLPLLAGCLSNDVGRLDLTFSSKLTLLSSSCGSTHWTRLHALWGFSAHSCNLTCCKGICRDHDWVAHWMVFEGTHRFTRGPWYYGTGADNPHNVANCTPPQKGTILRSTAEVSCRVGPQAIQMGICEPLICTHNVEHNCCRDLDVSMISLYMKAATSDIRGMHPKATFAVYGSCENVFFLDRPLVKRKLAGSPSQA